MQKSEWPAGTMIRSLFGRCHPIAIAPVRSPISTFCAYTSVVVRGHVKKTLTNPLSNDTFIDSDDLQSTPESTNIQGGR